MKSKPTQSSGKNVLQIVLCLVAIAGCLGAAYFVARAGLAQLYAERTLALGNADVANRAVQLAPASADAHFARAVTLLYGDQTTEANAEYESAAALRPRDYFLWLALGIGRDHANDDKGAIAAFEQSVRLAPYYAEPRWQLGNVLLRAGQTDQAFVQLREAAKSDPSLLSGLMDLAWGVYGGSPATVEQVIQPQTNQARVELARFFIRHGRAAEAIEQFKKADVVPESDQTAIVQQLIAARRFKEAYEIWSARAKSTDDHASILSDGSFEAVKNFEPTGFQWQAGRDPQGIKLSLDQHEAHEGKSSLRINYQGSANVNMSAISRLVVVDAGTHYRLKFWAKTQNLISGGLPVLMVRDAGADNGPPLAQSAPLPKSSNGWQEYTLDFDSLKDTSAIEINLKRQPCAQEQCPIFGDVWLDSFSLQKISG